jgi:hypothetical protein
VCLEPLPDITSPEEEDEYLQVYIGTYGIRASQESLFESSVTEELSSDPVLPCITQTTSPDDNSQSEQILPLIRQETSVDENPKSELVMASITTSGDDYSQCGQSQSADDNYQTQQCESQTQLSEVVDSNVSVAQMWESSKALMVISMQLKKPLKNVSARAVAAHCKDNDVDFQILENQGQYLKMMCEFKVGDHYTVRIVHDAGDFLAFDITIIEIGNLNSALCVFHLRSINVLVLRDKCFSLSETHVTIHFTCHTTHALLNIHNGMCHTYICVGNLSDRNINNTAPEGCMIDFTISKNRIRSPIVQKTISGQLEISHFCVAHNF